MNHIRRIAAALVTAASVLLTLIATSPAALAIRVPPPGWLRRDGAGGAAPGAWTHTPPAGTPNPISDPSPHHGHRRHARLADHAHRSRGRGRRCRRGSDHGPGVGRPAAPDSTCRLSTPPSRPKPGVPAMTAARVIAQPRSRCESNGRSRRGRSGRTRRAGTPAAARAVPRQGTSRLGLAGNCRTANRPTVTAL